MRVRRVLVEERVQVAVLAVVDLARAFVDLQRDADVLLLEDRREVRLRPSSSGRRPSAAPPRCARRHAHVEVHEGVVALPSATA
jgi:hypothetical protein